MPLPKHTWPGRDSKLIPSFHGPIHYCILFNKLFNTSFWDLISGLEGQEGHILGTDYMGQVVPLCRVVPAKRVDF